MQQLPPGHRGPPPPPPAHHQQQPGARPPPELSSPGPGEFRPRPGFPHAGPPASQPFRPAAPPGQGGGFQTSAAPRPPGLPPQPRPVPGPGYPSAPGPSSGPPYAGRPPPPPAGAFGQHPGLPPGVPPGQQMQPRPFLGGLPPSQGTAQRQAGMQTAGNLLGPPQMASAPQAPFSGAPPVPGMPPQGMPPQQGIGGRVGPVTAADMQTQQLSPTSPSEGLEPFHRRRPAYPTGMATAYTGGGDVDPFGYGGPSDSRATSQPQPPVTAGAGYFFTPGLGADVAPAPASGQQQGLYDPNAMAQQFGNVSLNPAVAGTTRPLNPVALMGAPPDVSGLEDPPPQILLDPSAPVTRSPTAICDSFYKRCTLNAVPQTPGLLSKSRLPFGLILTPFRSLRENEEPLPTVSDNTIVRCRSCRTYINPFVQFLEGGNSWKCNICYLVNDVPSSFDFDQTTGQPVNRWERVELNHAVFEYIAPSEYMVRPPQALAYVFVIDVSYAAVQSGMVATAAKTILDTLDRIPNEDRRTKIGFITVDSAVHFYSIGAGRSSPQMLVVSDLEEVYLPQPEDLLCNLAESRTVVDTLLEQMGVMFKDTQNDGNALGPALQAAFKLLASVGGKIIVLQSTLPNFGVGALTPRGDARTKGSAKEAFFLQPAIPFYKSFAVDCSRAQVTVDMFLFGQQYSDVATLNAAPEFTGGTTFYYLGFNAGVAEDAVKFSQELADHLSARIGLEAVMRVRVSKGLRMTAYLGNFFVRSTDLLAFPSVTPDHSYAAEVAIDENINASVVSFQTALLHTTCYGERRIRVVTLALPVTSRMQDLYASVDQLAVASLLAKKAVKCALTAKLEDARAALLNKVVDILGVYKTCLTASSSGATSQLTLCNNLKLLPLLVLGITKHVAFQGSSRIPIDLRSFAMSLLNILPPEALIPYIYPKLYALHRLPPNVGSPDESGRLVMPPPVNLSAEKLEQHGVYLLQTGEVSFLSVGRNTHPQLCMDLFDAPNVDALRSGKFILPVLDTDVSVATHLIMSYTRAHMRSKIFPHTYMVKDDGHASLRPWFCSLLVEDRTGEDLSYNQYLATLKEKVNNGSF